MGPEFILETEMELILRQAQDDRPLSFFGSAKALANGGEPANLSLPA
jgi:hypothetical protein